MIILNKTGLKKSEVRGGSNDTIKNFKMYDDWYVSDSITAIAM